MSDLPPAPPPAGGPPPSGPPPAGPPPGQQPPPYQPPPGQPYQAPVYQGAATAQITNQKATISLILGIISCVCCFICGPFAIYFANQAKREIAASGGTQSGEGLATAGLITGIIGTIFIALGILYFIIVVLAIGHSVTNPGG